MSRILKYSEAILEATDQLMSHYPNVYVIGLGVPDPKGIFGTTVGLQEKYGPDRVMDMPESENAMTGIAIGTAILGSRPIMTHQRTDFILLALDQIINNAAKWHYMFGGKMKVPLVIRLITGKGWGQGPQHSQTLFSLFCHIPGLKVVAPTTPYDAKGLLISAVEEDNPVLFLEHRWLHHISGEVPIEMYQIPFGESRILQKGEDITVVSLSEMTLQALKAHTYLQQIGISLEIIDVRSLKPFDDILMLESLKKTGRLMVLEPDWKTCGFASEVITLAIEKGFSFIKAPPIRITYPNQFAPTSWALSNHYYPNIDTIIKESLLLMGKKTYTYPILEEMLYKKMREPLDTPDASFIGPF